DRVGGLRARQNPELRQGTIQRDARCLHRVDFVSPLRKSRTRALNSSAFSSCGMWPQSSTITFFDPAIAFSSRSAPAGFASSSYLPQTTRVGALTPRTSASLNDPSPFSPASCIFVIVNADRSRIGSCSSTILSVTRLLLWNRILKNSRVSSRVTLFWSWRRRAASAGAAPPRPSPPPPPPPPAPPPSPAT